MKLKASTGRKLRYGGTSIALTALIITAVIIVNALTTLIVQKFGLYVDLTPDLHFTISDECYDLIGAEVADDGNDTPIEMVKKFRENNKAYNAANGLKPGDEGYKDENVTINIIFLSEKDILQADSTTNYVVVNAEELRAKYPEYIKTEYIDSVTHPSKFKKYLYSNTDTIESDSVIIECGTEFRIRTLRSFYVFSNDETPTAYNGEKALASSILAVTRAEAPLACYTTNHGEEFPQSNIVDTPAPFISSLEDAGYEVRPLDLSKEEIPAECRILIVFDPKNDFITDKDGASDSCEITKLEKFLNERNSLMVFMEPDSYTGRLTNLEDFLEEWGLIIKRNGDDPYMVSDPANSIMGNHANVVADYSKSDIATSWMANMLNRATPPKVVIPNAAALDYANSYDRKLVTSEKDETVQYYLAYSSTYNRTVYDLFYTYEGAKANAGGQELAQSSKTNPLSLMSVSVQSFSEQEANGLITDSAYVLLCGSTDFASEKYLSSNTYGNADFMLSALQMAGREPVPVGLQYKEFANYTIESITSSAATTYTVIFTVAPIVLALIAGVFVIVRRKNR